MGKTEKIVVLSILFLVVLLFVWSMGGQEADASERNGGTDSSSARYSDQSETREPAPPGADRRADGAAAANGRNDGGQPQGPGGSLLKRPGSPESLGGSSGVEGAGQIEFDKLSGSSSNLLHAVVDRDSKTAPMASRRQSPAVHMRPGWDIVTTDGLERTVNPDMLLYRPEAKATWESLAVDLYGDASKEMLLRHNNEGMANPGEIIFVPAKDDRADEVENRVVEVLKGETLWQVSKRTLGRGSRWRELFEANRGVISDPDYLAPGTILTVPAR